jgi:uncharacterized membrane protein YcaP (DUF421 family)
MPWHIHLPSYVAIVVRSTIVYLAMLAGLRLAGKRHTGQLSPHDFVLILLVSNAVQNAMVGEDTTVHGGLIAAATLIVLNTLLSRFVLHHHRVNRLLTGEPTLLVHNGKIVKEHLRREGIRREELEAQIREHGFEGPEDVKTAIQECDGSISVIGWNNNGEKRLPGLKTHRRLVRHVHRPGWQG